MTTSTDSTLPRRDALKLLAGAGALAATSARPRRARAAGPVRLGTIKTPHWAASWLIAGEATSEITTAVLRMSCFISDSYRAGLIQKCKGRTKPHA